MSLASRSPCWRSFIQPPSPPFKRGWGHLRSRHRPRLLCTDEPGSSPSPTACHMVTKRDETSLAGYAYHLHALPSFACLFIRSQSGSPCRVDLSCRGAAVQGTVFPEEPYLNHTLWQASFGTRSRVMNGVSEKLKRRCYVRLEMDVGWTSCAVARLASIQLIVHPKKHDLMERGAHTQVLRWHQEPVRPIDGARGAQEPVLEH